MWKGLFTWASTFDHDTWLAEEINTQHHGIGSNGVLIFLVLLQFTRYLLKHTHYLVHIRLLGHANLKHDLEPFVSHARDTRYLSVGNEVGTALQISQGGHTHGDALNSTWDISDFYHVIQLILAFHQNHESTEIVTYQVLGTKGNGQTNDGGAANAPTRSRLWLWL